MPEPYELSKAMAPHSGLLGASLGAGIGGLSGLLSDPGYDEETGDRKSRFRAVLKGLTGGGLIGGAAGAAAPFAAEGYGRNLAGPVQSLLGGGEEKEVKAAVMYSLEKVSSYRKNQSAARVKMASAVLHLDAINRELDSYNLYDLRKSAAIGVRRAERMKVAALIRQRELEKRAFSKAFMGKGGKGGKGGLGQSLGKAFSGFKDYAFGAAPRAGAAAKKPTAKLPVNASQEKTNEILQRARQPIQYASLGPPMPHKPRGADGKVRTTFQKMTGRNKERTVKDNTPMTREFPQRPPVGHHPGTFRDNNIPKDAVYKGPPLRHTNGELFQGVPQRMSGMTQNLPKPGFSPGLGGPGGGAAAAGLGTLAALTQLPGHGSGQPKPKTYQSGSSVPGIGYPK